MSTEKYRIFDKLIEGVQVISKDYKYFYVNDTVAIQGKSSKENLLGYSMIEKYPGIENTEMFGMLKICMENGLPSQVVNEFDFPDGSKGYFELRMQAVEDGVLIFSFDVTEQKLAEKILHGTNALLEQKVKQRTAELQSKNRDLEQFAYIASHDLQEPLRTISNYIEVLEEDYKENLDPVARGYIDSIHRAANRMSILTKALLDYSRLGRDRVLVSVNCRSLIEEVLSDLSGLVNTSGAVVTIGNMPVLNVYETEFRQLFQNLISNAIKFRDKDRTPAIFIEAAEDDSKWQFEVRDNGIGIPSEYSERIFHMFQRLHLPDKYEGNGIGLAYCKKIVEVHGGEIGVKSLPDKGSIFYFTILKL